MSIPENFPDYFTLFQLPIRFRINYELLEKNYFKLQNMFHPDRHIFKAEIEKHIILDFATYINEAFKTLKFSLPRAKYLLELQKYLDDSTLSQPSKKILLEQIHYREQLEYAIKNKDFFQINNIQKKIQLKINECEKDFGIFNENKQFSICKILIYKWQFLEKISSEINGFLSQI